MTITQLKNIILEAFVNVKLGDGVSLKQAKILDNYGNGATEAEFRALPQSEITDKWRDIPLDDLEKYSNIDELDAEGFRYYIPAFMIALLDRYDPGSIRVIRTLSQLRPYKEHSWDNYMAKYSLLDTKQTRAIAVYLSELPNLLTLDLSNSRVVERALRDYWGQFLQKPEASSQPSRNP